MANNKLFQKRKAKTQKDLKRKSSNRSPYKKVLIICEDSHSAPSYFEKLVDHYNIKTAHIEPQKKHRKSWSPSPCNLVQFYINKIPDDFDYVFFVFDRDTHSTYDGAIAKIERLNNKKVSIQAITSVPSFELWLKLHFDDSSRPYDRAGKNSPADVLIDDLKQLDAFKNYTKDSKCTYFDNIKEHTDTAIRNAEILLNNGLETEDNKHHVNPSTLIHELVKVLRDEIKPK